MNVRYSYICSKCKELWWYDPQNGNCPICNGTIVLNIKRSGGLGDTVSIETKEPQSSANECGS